MLNRELLKQTLDQGQNTVTTPVIAIFRGVAQGTHGSDGDLFEYGGNLYLVPVYTVRPKVNPTGFEHDFNNVRLVVIPAAQRQGGDPNGQIDYNKLERFVPELVFEKIEELPLDVEVALRAEVHRKYKVSPGQSAKIAAPN